MNATKIEEKRGGAMPYASIVAINRRIFELLPENPSLAIEPADELQEYLCILEGKEHDPELFHLARMKSEIEEKVLYRID